MEFKVGQRFRWTSKGENPVWSIVRIDGNKIFPRLDYRAGKDWFLYTDVLTENLRLGFIEEIITPSLTQEYNIACRRQGLSEDDIFRAMLVMDATRSIESAKKKAREKRPYLPMPLSITSLSFGMFPVKGK